MTPRPRSEVLAALNRRDNRDFPPPCCHQCESKEAAAKKLRIIAECEFESAEMERAAAQHLVEVAHRKEAGMLTWERQLREREDAVAFRGRVVAGLAVAVAALELFVRWG